MTDTNLPDDVESERAQAEATVQADQQTAVVDDSRAESERIRRRLGAAVIIPLASLVILVLLMATVSMALIEAQHIGNLLPPLVAGLVAVGTVVTAWRGWLKHDPRMSFVRLLGGISLVGVVLLGGTVWLLRTDSGAGADLPAGVIAVQAREYELVAETWSAPEGEVTFNYESGGQIGHTLTIEGFEGELLLKVSPSIPMDSGSIQLEEGVYTVYCDLTGHRDLGMEATLEVTDQPESGGETESG